MPGYRVVGQHSIVDPLTAYMCVTDGTVSCAYNGVFAVHPRRYLVDIRYADAIKSLVHEVVRQPRNARITMSLQEKDSTHARSGGAHKYLSVGRQSLKAIRS
jgi:hypothetical protein